MLQQREGRELAPLRNIALASTSLEDRLRAHSTELDCGCVEWVGTAHNSGYGQMSFRGKPNLTHRLALLSAGVEIPVGSEVNHKCGLRRCLNVEHLEVVTPAENAEYKTAPFGRSGVRGVVITAQGRFQARANSGGKTYTFGTFPTLEEAEVAAIEGRKALGFHEPESPCDHSDVEYPRPSRSKAAIEARRIVTQQTSIRSVE